MLTLEHDEEGPPAADVLTLESPKERPPATTEEERPNAFTDRMLSRIMPSTPSGDAPPIGILKDGRSARPRAEEAGAVAAIEKEIAMEEEIATVSIATAEEVAGTAMEAKRQAASNGCGAQVPCTPVTSEGAPARRSLMGRLLSSRSDTADMTVAEAGEMAGWVAGPSTSREPPTPGAAPPIGAAAPPARQPPRFRKSQPARAASKYHVDDEADVLAVSHDEYGPSSLTDVLVPSARLPPPLPAPRNAPSRLPPIAGTSQTPADDMGVPNFAVSNPISRATSANSVVSTIELDEYVTAMVRGGLAEDVAVVRCDGALY